ncbi:TlpA family protein disulfide reductase [Sphingobacterium pedocola]|uniref:Thioredoxin domain-containing protein n=1 Tax=Sphingobacterium pedocola TaxID=2082722 RepID=A0ABR9T1Y7_9SPHI|nr:redoxin domain-containing protein [Sphingobacterium pedocola]MBE8719345.1 hypothetical protein [Sphingobacterium pedocola]
MRKLRKGERYALWRAIDNAPFKTRRSPLRCAHRDDEQKKGIMQYLQPVTYCTRLVTLIISFICVLFSDAQAQSAGERAAEGLEEIKTLEIGDRVPEELWNLPLPMVNHPDGKDTITLKDYQNKVIVLDFLHSQCKSCIENLAKIKQLQSQLKDSVSFLILTKQRSENLFKTLNKEIIFSSALPWSYSAMPIATYFPYRIVSHYVIIKNGKVRAITGSSNITYDKLFSVLEGLPADFELKYDY